MKHFFLIPTLLFSLGAASQTYYDVQNYSINLDSSTTAGASNASALNSLITTASTAPGGGVIVFPSDADVAIDATVQIKSNVTLLGNGCTIFTKFVNAAQLPGPRIVFSAISGVNNWMVRNFRMISTPESDSQWAINTSTLKGRHGPTSNVRGFHITSTTNNGTVDSLYAKYLDQAIWIDGGAGATDAHHLRFYNITTDSVQQPLFFTNVDSITVRHLICHQWQEKNGDPLNHALYLQDSVSNFFMDDYLFQSGGGSLLNVTGRNTRIYNGQIKNAYHCITANDDYHKTSSDILIQNLDVDSTRWAFFGSTVGYGQMTMRNITIRKAHGDVTVGNPKLFYCWRGNNSTVRVVNATIYGNNNTLPGYGLFGGQGTHTFVFDSCTFVDWSTTASMFTTYSTTRHKKLVVTNSVFCFTTALNIPNYVVRLTATDSSVVSNNTFSVNKASTTGKYAVYNTTTGVHTASGNKTFGLEAFEEPRDAITVVTGTQSLITAVACALPGPAPGNRSWILSWDVTHNYIAPNGLNVNAIPGDTLLLSPGTYGTLDLGSLKGTRQKPIVITNTVGAQTVVRDFRLGTTDSASFIKVIGRPLNNGSYGIRTQGFTAARVDHLEITGVHASNADGIGIFVRYNPVAGVAGSQYPNFTQRRILVHHNLVERTKMEGINIGHPLPNGDPANGNLKPVETDSVEVYSNAVQKIGWDAIQVINALNGAFIHDNHIQAYGRAQNSANQTGILLGINTGGMIYRNLVDSGSGRAVELSGYGRLVVANNFFYRIGREILVANDPTDSNHINARQKVHFQNNVIQDPDTTFDIARVVATNNRTDSAVYKNNRVTFAVTPASWTADPNGLGGLWKNLNTGVKTLLAGNVEEALPDSLRPNVYVVFGANGTRAPLNLLGPVPIRSDSDVPLSIIRNRGVKKSSTKKSPVKAGGKGKAPAKK